MRAAGDPEVSDTSMRNGSSIVAPVNAANFRVNTPALMLKTSCS
jgi:hypothetical protein